MNTSILEQTKDKNLGSWVVKKFVQLVSLCFILMVRISALLTLFCVKFLIQMENVSLASNIMSQMEMEYVSEFNHQSSIAWNTNMLIQLESTSSTGLTDVKESATNANQDTNGVWPKKHV